MGRKPSYIKLSEEQRLELKEGHKNGKKNTFRQRCHYILLNSEGQSRGEIAKIYQTSRQTVSGWINRYAKLGIFGLQTAKGRGRPPIIRLDNDSEVKKIEDLVEQSPQNLKTALVKIKAELGKEMSKKTLQRFLKKKEWKWKRFRKVTGSDPDEADYKAKKELLCVLTMLFLLGHLDLRYGDESSFSLTPNVPYGWVRSGQTKALPARRGGTLNVFGLLNLLGELTTYQTTKSVNSQVVIGWLDDFAKTISKLTVVVLDNAPWHKSEAFMNKIEEWACLLYTSDAADD